MAVNTTIYPLPFTAKWHGTCHGPCRGLISPGEVVRYENNGEGGKQLLHDICDNDSIDAKSLVMKPNEVVCTTCFIIKPCECDDESGKH